jgi:hypothetical protein
MKNINVDDSAHALLMWAKTQLQGEGVESPSHSDAVRFLWKRGEVVRIHEEKGRQKK